ncbi:Pollen preferential protein [Quillaja saponaria]|uniref:Pollen preferential protein n=1 Tax=Quillaja saponaria TaxID=32244 RepID=A0AAD7PY64_QUISA|nr:Pollen preferential protein [Quillaja saponaria]
MSRQILIRPALSDRQQPLLKRQSSSGRFRSSEVIGGTTAECAAICCCCPCGLANFLLLAFYKVPAGLCRQALKKRRSQRLIKKGKGLVPPRRHSCKCGCDDTEIQIRRMDIDDLLDIKSPESELLEKEVVELEKEMWDRFYSTGFWRSPSQRDSFEN